MKTILSNKGTAGGITLPDFKLNYRMVLIRTTWYLHTNQYVIQRNQTHDADITLYHTDT